MAHHRLPAPDRNAEDRKIVDRMRSHGDKHGFLQVTLPDFLRVMELAASAVDHAERNSSQPADKKDA